MAKESAINSINNGKVNTRTFEYLKDHFDEMIQAGTMQGDLDDIKLLLDSYVDPRKLHAEREEVLLGLFLMVTRLANNSEYAKTLLSKGLERKALPEAGMPYKAVRFNVIRPALTRFAMGFNLGKKAWLSDGARDLQKALLTVPL